MTATHDLLAQDHAAVAIRLQPVPIVRYTSGLTIYDEALYHGRWIGRYWSGHGFVEPDRLLRWEESAAHTPDLIGGLDLATFGLEIDGQSLHFGWEFSHAREEAPIRTGSRHGVVELVSSLRPISVQVHTEVDGSGIMTRWLAITNNGERPAALGAVWPWSGLLFRPLVGTHVEKGGRSLGQEGEPAFSVGYMAERIWGNEGAFVWQPLSTPALRLESRTGKSGHGTPFFLVRNERTGEHVVGGLAWSGNWAIELTSEQLDTKDPLLAFRIGPVNPAPQRVIAVGETVETPRVHLGLIQTDFDGAIQAWHRHLRRSVLIPEIPTKEGLVVYNHWGYVEHEMDEQRLRFEIDVAVEIGAELFIVDAGWFGNEGTMWWTTVGDWKAGDRLPDGLQPIFAYAREKGLLYGLWFDLERLGSESQTAKEHPEWLLQRYGKPTPGGDMDLTHPAAVAHLEETLVRLIEQYDLDLFRLDFNTYPYEGGQVQRDGYMENTTWRYYENIYGLYDRMRARFPNLIMENCSGGGGRTDLGLVSRFHHTWVTDWQLAPRTMSIINGMSMALPPERVDRNAGVGQEGHHRGDLDFQMRACMFGHFTLTGIYPARGEENPIHVARIRHHVDRYKQLIRPFIATSHVYHHTPVLPGKEPGGWAVLEYVAVDRERAVVGLFRLAGPSDETYHLQLRGVDAGRRYRVTFDNAGNSAQIDGATLLYEGLDLRLARPLTSELLLLESTD
ncbi:MAG: alpha-galactosidase [Chloroflexi bacterium]|nr:alpha-galactosidase [Chloroflexota bacterium]